MSSFIPNVGALVTRVVVSNAFFGFYLCYRDDKEAEQHYSAICCVENFEAKPYFSGQIDLVMNTAELVGYGDVAIHRHFTTWPELLAIPRLWSDRQVTVYDWLEDVNDLDDLPEEQKERIRKALKHHISRNNT